MGSARSPEWDAYAALPIERESPLKRGGVLQQRVWCCHQPGDKTDGVNFDQCLRVKKLPPTDIQRPTCKRHRRAPMSRAGSIYQMPDGTMVRYRP
jgi:hypothetical protein